MYKKLIYKTLKNKTLLIRILSFSLIILGSIFMVFYGIDIWNALIIVIGIVFLYFTIPKKKKLIKPVKPVTELYPEDFEAIKETIGKEKFERLMDIITELQAKLTRLELEAVKREEIKEREKRIKESLIKQAKLKTLDRIRRRKVYDFKKPYKTKVVSSYLNQNLPFYVENDGKIINYPLLAGMVIEFDKDGNGTLLFRLAKDNKSDKVYELPICPIEYIPYYLDFQYLQSFNSIRVHLKPDGTPLPRKIHIDPNITIEEIENENSKKLLKMKLEDLRILDWKGIEKAFITVWKERDDALKEINELKIKLEEMTKDRNQLAHLLERHKSDMRGDNAIMSAISEELDRVKWKLKKRDIEGAKAEWTNLLGELLMKGMFGKLKNVEELGASLIPEPPKKEEIDVIELLKSRPGEKVETSEESKETE